MSEARQPKLLSYRSLHDFLLAPGDLWEVDESKMAPAAAADVAKAAAPPPPPTQHPAAFAAQRRQQQSDSGRAHMGP